jgi:hypothetical protein
VGKVSVTKLVVEKVFSSLANYGIYYSALATAFAGLLLEMATIYALLMAKLWSGNEWAFLAFTASLYLLIEMFRAPAKGFPARALGLSAIILFSGVVSVASAAIAFEAAFDLTAERDYEMHSREWYTNSSNVLVETAMPSLKLARTSSASVISFLVIYAVWSMHEWWTARRAKRTALS